MPTAQQTPKGLKPNFLNMGQDRIYREYRADIIANDGILEGHASVFNKIANIGGWFEETIMPGAFDDADMTDVPFLLNHARESLPLARSRRNNANSTLQLATDEIGLAIRAAMDTARNADAMALYSAVERGDIDQMSFVFEVSADIWENLEYTDGPASLPRRFIQKFKKIVDVSAVTWPAYAETDLHARDATALENARQALEKAKTQNNKEARAIFDKELFKIKLMKG